MNETQAGEGCLKETCSPGWAVCSFPEEPRSTWAGKQQSVARSQTLRWQGSGEGPTYPAAQEAPLKLEGRGTTGTSWQGGGNLNKVLIAPPPPHLCGDSWLEVVTSLEDQLPCQGEVLSIRPELGTGRRALEASLPQAGSYRPGKPGALLHSLCVLPHPASVRLPGGPYKVLLCWPPWGKIPRLYCLTHTYKNACGPPHHFQPLLTHWVPDAAPWRFSSVIQSCPTLCDPMDCSTPGLPVHCQLPEFTQTHVHWVGDAIQPSHPLLSPSPAFSLSQHQGLFQWVTFLHQVAKVLEFKLQHQPFQWIFRTGLF